MRVAVCLAVVLGVATAQYGPLPAGNSKRRTTTTTEIPDSANEVLPPAPYQPPPGYQPPQQGSQPGPQGQQGPPSQPGTQGQPATPYQAPPPPPAPKPYQPQPGVAQAGAPVYQPGPQVPVGPQGQPGPQGAASTPYQPQVPQTVLDYQNFGSPRPKPNPGQFWWSNPQTNPFKPGAKPQPFVPPAPQQPGCSQSPPGAPSRPNYPAQPQRPSFSPGFQQQSPQPVPSNPGFQPQQPVGSPSKPNYPPQPQQPSPSQGIQPQPAQPAPSSPGFQPQQPAGSPSKPNYPPQPQQPAGSPSKPNYPPQPQQPSPSQGIQPQPAQPAPSSPGFQPQQPAGSPSKPNYPPQPQQPSASPSFQPQPQQPAPVSPGFSPQPQQPLGPPNRPGFPPQPQFPISASPSRPAYPPQPSPQRPNPTNPFLPNPAPQPVQPSCNGQGLFCVPASFCYNGIVSDVTGNPTKKGPCGPGEVCCKTKKPITTVPGYPNQPLPRPNYATEAPVQKYTGPLNTTPSPECAAALKCVDISYCTAEGVMSNTPVVLTREQSENRVPLSDCQDVTTGFIGKCCRDPNYKDPWPAGMMMPKATGGDDGQNFDDGQYHPSPEEGQYTTAVNPYTIKKPLGVFGQEVTPFPVGPVGPKPGQTHSQVFPSNEDKVFAKPAPFTPHHTSVPVAPYQPQQPGYQPQPQLYQPGTPPQPSPQPGQPQTPLQQPYQPSQPGTPYQPNTQPGSPYQPSTQPGSPYQPSPQPNQPQTPSQQPYQPSPQPGQPQTQQPYQPQTYSQQPSTSPYQSQTQPQPSKLTPQPSQPTSPAQPLPPTQENPVPGQDCGVRRNTVGDQPDETGFGEFPWHALIVSKSNGSALCSAAIIAPNAVLTAAHCIQGLEPTDLVIKAGGGKLGADGPRPSQNRPVGAAAIHPSYDSGSLVKDQAVVVSEEPLTFDQHIDKVCLAPSTSGDYQPTGKQCYVTGYGRPALHRGTPGTPLHKVKVDLIPKDQCENKLKQTHLGKFFILNQGFTCAVPPSEAELCKVDVGSPLVCERSDGKYELAGVYSWDTKCSSELPGIMASCDTDWIKQVLATPIAQLREEYNKKPTFHAVIITDVSSKPGFALGYGK